LSAEKGKTDQAENEFHLGTLGHCILQEPPSIAQIGAAITLEARVILGAGDKLMDFEQVSSSGSSRARRARLRSRSAPAAGCRDLHEEPVNATGNACPREMLYILGLTISGVA
jgi:hypothetical protein